MPEHGKISDRSPDEPFLRCYSSPRYSASLPAGHVFPMRKFPDSAARLVVAPRDRYAIDLLRGWGIPMVVLYGGGYNKAEGMTTELHCQTIRIAAQRHRSEREREEAKSAWSL